MHRQTNVSATTGKLDGDHATMSVIGSLGPSPKPAETGGPAGSRAGRVPPSRDVDKLASSLVLRDSAIVIKTDKSLLTELPWH